MTRQRRIIYEVVRASEEHLTAEEIFLRARERLASLSIATVYRNLGLMVRDGEVRRVTVAGADRYDRNVSRHDHLICAKCGRMADVTAPELAEGLERLTGRRLLSYELNMYHICPDCAGREDGGPDAPPPCPEASI